MSDETPLPRETGSDKSGTTCFTCGTDLPSVSSPFGSVSAGSCPKCSKGSLREAELALAQGTEDRGWPLGDPSEDWKVSHLTAYAEAAGVDLEGAGRSRTSLVERIGDKRAPESPQA